MHGPHSVDYETFTATLKELGDEDPIAYGVTVVFEDRMRSASWRIRTTETVA